MAEQPSRAYVAPKDAADALAQALFEAEDWKDTDAERFAVRALDVLRSHGWDVARWDRTAPASGD